MPTRTSDDLASESQARLDAAALDDYLLLTVAVSMRDTMRELARLNAYTPRHAQRAL